MPKRGGLNWSVCYFAEPCAVLSPAKQSVGLNYAEIREQVKEIVTQRRTSRGKSQMCTGYLHKAHKEVLRNQLDAGKIIKNKEIEAETNVTMEQKMKGQMLYDTVNGLIMTALHKRFLTWYYRSSPCLAFRSRTLRAALATLGEIAEKRLLRKGFTKLLANN